MLATTRTRSSDGHVSGQQMERLLSTYIVRLARYYGALCSFREIRVALGGDLFERLCLQTRQIDGLVAGPGTADICLRRYYTRVSRRFRCGIALRTFSQLERQ